MLENSLTDALELRNQDTLCLKTLKIFNDFPNHDLQISQLEKRFEGQEHETQPLQKHLSPTRDRLPPTQACQGDAQDTFRGVYGGCMGVYAKPFNCRKSAYLRDLNRSIGPHMSGNAESGRILDNSENYSRYLSFTEPVSGGSPPTRVCQRLRTRPLKG